MDANYSVRDFVDRLAAKRAAQNTVTVGKPQYKQFPIILLRQLKSDQFPDRLSLNFKSECKNRRGFAKGIPVFRQNIVAKSPSGHMYHIFVGPNHKPGMTKLFVDYFREKGRTVALLTDDYVFVRGKISFSFLDCTLVPNKERRHRVELGSSQIVKAAKRLVSGANADSINIETWENSGKNPTFWEQDTRACARRTDQVIRLLSSEFGAPTHQGGDELSSLLNHAPILHAAIWEINSRRLGVCGFADKMISGLFIDVRDNRKPRKKK
jgi:hypothetical protein